MSSLWASELGFLDCFLFLVSLSLLSIGPNNCPGQTLARMELRSVISRVVTEYEFGFPPNSNFDHKAFFANVKDHFVAGIPKQALVFKKRIWEIGFMYHYMVSSVAELGWTVTRMIYIPWIWSKLFTSPHIQPWTLLFHFVGRVLPVCSIHVKGIWVPFDRNSNWSEMIPESQTSN